MGATLSKSTIDIVTDIAVNVTQQSLQDCMTSVDASQVIDFSGSTGDLVLNNVSQTQAVSVNHECAFSSEKQSDIQSNIANALAQFVSAESEGLLTPLGGTKAEIEATIRNKLANNITQTDKQESIASITSSQQFLDRSRTGNVVISGLSQTQSTELVARSMMTTSGFQSVFNDVANSVDQSAESKSQGLVASVAKTLGITATAAMLAIPLAIGAVVFLIILIIVLPFMLMGKSNDKVETQPAPSSMMGTTVIPIGYGNQRERYDATEMFRGGAECNCGTDCTCECGCDESGECKCTLDCPCSCGCADAKDNAEEAENTSSEKQSDEQSDEPSATGGCTSCGCGCPDDPETPGKCSKDCECGCWKKEK